MPDNDSSTRGFLKPGPGIFRYDFILGTDPRYWFDNVPIDGQPLEDLMHQMLQGITGLPPTLVRPWYQPEPAPLPPWDTDWVAFVITNSELDRGFAWEWPEPPPAPPNWADPDTQGVYYQQHESFDLLIATYGPHCDWYDSLIRDGFSVSQNRELLLLTAMGLIHVGSGKLVPEFVQQRWYRRIDRVVRIHREIRRLYPILEVLSSQGIVARDTLPPSGSV